VSWRARGAAAAAAAAALVAGTGCGAPHNLARLSLHTDPGCAPCESTVTEHLRTGVFVGDERGPFESWKLTLRGGEVVEYKVPPGLSAPLIDGPHGLSVVVRHEREEDPSTIVPVVVRERLSIVESGTGELVFGAGGGRAGRVDLPGVRVELDLDDESPSRPFGDPCGVHTMHRIRFTPDPGAVRAGRAKKLWPGERARLRIGGKLYRIAAIAATKGPAAPACPGYDGTEFSFVVVRVR
jgi:hypothetical protein